MAIRTPPSWLQNGSHPAENDRLSMQGLWRSTGILGSSDLQVTQNSSPNMTVNISSGWAAIVGNYQTNMGAYVVYNDAPLSATITTANASNPRIDLICLTVADAYYTGSLNNVTLNVVAGTPSGSPAVPSTPINSIALAQVYVGAGVTSILTANITNVATQASTPIGISSTATITAVDFVTSTSNGTGVGSFDNTLMNLLMGAM